MSKALRKDREERYQTIRDLLIDLKSLKEETEFLQKLERSQPPESREEASATRPAAEAATENHGAARAGEVLATAGPGSEATKRTRRTVMVTVVVALIASFVVACAAIVWRRSGSSPVVSAPSAVLTTTVERLVRYGITVQKYRNNKPYQDPFRLRDDINFEKDYRIRLHVASAQSGRLYLLNEGPATADQTPMLKVLFPSSTANKGSALLTANQEIQIPEESWFQLDDQQGTEKIWLIWAEKDVPELEAVKGFVNRKDQGVIKSPELQKAVYQFLKAHPTAGVSVERSEEKKETLVKAKGEILVHVIKLEHN